MEVIQFYDYSKQDKKWYAKRDEVTKNTKQYYYKAIDIVDRLMRLILDKDRKNFKASLLYMLNLILKLKK